MTSDIEVINVAIIIGVSNYKNIQNLPACKNDANMMKLLIDTSGKYRQTLFISENTSSNYVRNTLSSFINEIQGSPINELLFYYSGHGEFTDDFHFLLSDYDLKKKNQTSLDNEQLDNMLRSLNPNLTIKIVDACNAGVNYIKEAGVFENRMQKSKDYYHKCYFMFSSLNNQSSWADNQMSRFTQSICDCVIDYAGKEIRIRDVMDFVSDQFEGKAEQTPYFIVQADYTEKWFLVPTDIMNIIIEESEEKKPKDTSLEKIVRDDASKYCNKDEADKILNKLADVAKDFRFSVLLENLYNIEASFEKEYVNTPSLEAIGKWLDTNTHNYFAKSKSRINRVEEVGTYVIPNYFTSSSMLLSTGMGAREKESITTKPQKVVTGFEVTVELPFQMFIISANNLLPNIPKGVCHIIFVLSKTSIRFFYFYTTLQENSWETYCMPSTMRWKTSESRLKDDDHLLETFNRILVGFYEYMVEEIRKQFENVEANNPMD